MCKSTRYGLSARAGMTRSDYLRFEQEEDSVYAYESDDSVSLALATIIVLALANSLNVKMAVDTPEGSCAAVFSQITVDLDKPPKTQGVLEAGGDFIGVDGISISAPVEMGEESVEVTVEQVDAPVQELPFEEFEIISRHYLVSSSREVDVIPNYFEVSFPIPENLSRDQVSVAVHRPAEYDYDTGKTGLIWTAPPTYTTADGNISIRHTLLLTEGITIVLVKLPSSEDNVTE